MENDLSMNWGNKYTLVVDNPAIVVWCIIILTLNWPATSLILCVTLLVQDEAKQCLNCHCCAVNLEEETQSIAPSDTRDSEFHELFSRAYHWQSYNKCTANFFV